MGGLDPEAICPHDQKVRTPRQRQHECPLVNPLPCQMIESPFPEDASAFARQPIREQGRVHYIMPCCCGGVGGLWIQAKTSHLSGSFIGYGVRTAGGFVRSEE